MNIDESYHRRTVVHFDLDAFYVACERELNPALVNQPVAVSQYNPHGNLHETHSSEIEKRLVVRPLSETVSNRPQSHEGTNGSMIAVSYEARRQGVKRGDRGMDAVNKCPGLFIVQVPVKRGKADLTMYRRASNRIIDCLLQSILDFPGTDIKRSEFKVEKASIDEIYIDLSIPVDLMTRRIHSIGDRDKTDAIPPSDDAETVSKLQLWKHVIHHAKEVGGTSIGGIEIMTETARAANQLSKNEVRKGSKFQTFENTMDAGSQKWWDRPLPEWTEIELHLACGSALAAFARHNVQTKFRQDSGDVFTLSAGISSNKTLAKLASGLKKPNQQTIINPSDEGALQKLFHPMPVSRLRGLGGKLGEGVMTRLKVATVGDLAQVPLTVLETEYPTSNQEENSIASHLYEISRGICMEDVSERTIEKSMSSGKTFRGALALSVIDEVTVFNWISELLGSLLERLEDDYDTNMRLPGLLSLSVKLVGSHSHASKSCRAPSNISHESFYPLILKLYKQHCLKRRDKIQGITITASNFNEVSHGRGSILNAFERLSQVSSQGLINSSDAIHSSKSDNPDTMPHQISQSEENIATSHNILPSNPDDGKTITVDRTQSCQAESKVSSKASISQFGKKRRQGTMAIENWFHPRKQASLESKIKPKKTVKEDDSQNQKISGRCSLRYEDIDQGVLAELPFHIQAMVRKEMRQLKPKRL